MANEKRLTEKHWSGEGYYMKCTEVLRCDGLCGNCDELEKLVDRLGEFEDKAENTVVPSWIPVFKQLPEEDTRVLVYLGGRGREYTHIDTDRLHGNRWVRWNGAVTHWMPLPEPPGEVAE